ncbi:MAG: hypothetical protein N4A59_10790 [Marinifilum sp.]|jgi:hypothetical protein|nr:hypothetical protein [Marinifilum sp.]
MSIRKFKRIVSIVLSTAILSLTSCSKEELYNDLDTLTGEGVIKIDQSKVSGKIGRVFSKYAYIEAPNGGKIAIFGTSGVSDEQMIYAKKIMKQYLDIEGDLYKSGHKEIIANSLANKRAALTFWDDQNQAEEHLDKISTLGYSMQDLYATESLNSGSRDASYEEILHLVHNLGIAPTLFKYQQRLQKANDAAIKKGIWHPGRDSDDLPESDFDDEYFAAIMDCYLGLWEGKGATMGGEYQPSSKKELKTMDPAGYQLIRDLFGDIMPVK